MAILIEDSFPLSSPLDFAKHGDSVTVTKNNTNNLLVFNGYAQAGATGWTPVSFKHGTVDFDQDIVGDDVGVVSFELKQLALSIKDANIVETAQTLDFVWAGGVLTPPGAGSFTLISGVDQTTPFVDQSGTSGVQEAAIVSGSAAPDLTITCPAGAIVFYTVVNNTADGNLFTDWTRINRGAAGGGDTGSSQLDEGATYARIFSTAQTNLAIVAPLSGTTNIGYHSVSAYRAATVDSTAPVLTVPAASSITQDGVTPEVTTDEGNGTAYMVVVPNGDVPSVAQIKAGQQSSGAAAIANSNQTVSGTGVQSFTAVTGLAGSTDYEIYFVHTDAATNDSTAVTVGFTTSADTVPDAFSFTDVTDIGLSTPTISSSITVAGVTGSPAISVDTGEYRIDGGSWVTAPGTINNGQTAELRHTSSASNSTVTSQTLTIGGVSDQWDVTTEAAADDVIPDAFSFTDVTGQTPSSTSTSDVITVSGITGAATISIVGGSYKINSGSYGTGASTINNGDTVTLQVANSASENALTSVTLTIGGVSDQWDSTTFIVSVDTVDAAIAYGDTFNFTTSNFGTITDWQLDDGINTIILGGTDTTTSIASLADSIDTLLTGTVTLTISDGTFTKSITTVLSAPPGFSSIKLVSGFITTNLSYLFNYGTPPAIGDEFIYNMLQVTLLDDGNWEAPGVGVTTIYAIDATDGRMQTFNLITSDTSDDVTPDQFTLGLDITDAALSSLYEDSFLVSGLDVDITWTATGAGQVSLSEETGFGASVSAGNGVRIYFRLTASASNNTTVIGGIIAGLVSDEVSITTLVQVLNVSDTLVSAPSTPVASQTLDYILRQTWAGGITDQGTLATDAAGLFTLTNVNAVAGPAWISIKSTTDDNVAVIFPVTVA